MSRGYYQDVLAAHDEVGRCRVGGMRYVAGTTTGPSRWLPLARTFQAKQAGAEPLVPLLVPLAFTSPCISSPPQVGLLVRDGAEGDCAFAFASLAPWKVGRCCRAAGGRAGGRACVWQPQRCKALLQRLLISAAVHSSRADSCTEFPLAAGFVPP